MKNPLPFPVCLVCAWGCLLEGGAPAAPSFVSGPAVDASSGAAVISFAVNEPVDVEVAVIDAGGKVVRHLAAGVLGGENTPPAPLQAGLSQSLSWDGRDDAGNRVSTGDCTVRVRLGLKPFWQYWVNTVNFPGSHCGSPYAPRAWEETVNRSNPIFPRITSETPPGLYITVNEAYQELYIHLLHLDYLTYWRYNARTGTQIGYKVFQFKDTWQKGGDLEFSWDGETAYNMSTLGHCLYRYTRLGVFTPFPVTNKDKVVPLQLSHQHERGHAVGPDKSIYVLHHPQDTEMVFINEYDNFQSAIVSKIDTTGVITDYQFIPIHAIASCIKLDPQGNIFVGARVKPVNELIPPYVDTLLTGSAVPDSIRWWAEEMYGSILKFRPAGGGLFVSASDTCHIEAGKNIGVTGVSRYKLRAEGLDWMYYGVSPVCTHFGHRRSDAMKFPARGAACLCNVMRFDVDRFGRVFVPDPFNLSIVALDNNRNMMFKMNHRDMIQMLTQLGQMGKVPLLGWPNAVEADDYGMYVSDQINNQVVCFRFDAEVDTTLPVDVAIEGGIADGAVPVFNNSPNPFYSSTVIRYRLTGNTVPVRLSVYNLKGEQVKALVHTVQGPGAFSVAWDGRDGKGRSVGSGIYLCRLTSNGKTMEIRLAALK